MKDNHPWRFIHDRLDKDIPVILLIIVESDGSTPGQIGFKMAVASDGALAGTIGGGIVEHRLVEKARAKLKTGDQTPLLQRQVHSHDAATDRSGMICGGRQTIALYPCKKTDLAAVRHLIQWFEHREKGILPRGILNVSPSGISFTPNGHNKEKYVFRFQEENEWRYEENFGPMNTAYVIGGGHVGLALSRVLAMLDFRIVVLDERPDVGTFKDNGHAHEKITVSYGEIGRHVPDGGGDGEENYAFIMTPDHKADKLVLHQLLDKRLYYLGMMGSAKKVDEIFTRLRHEGVPAERLQKIHAPIGLPIKSHTPAEIAISIAAEIISLKNG